MKIFFGHHIRILLSLWVFFCSCCHADRPKESQRPDLNKESLQGFIFNIPHIGSSESCKQLDSILGEAEKDSLYFHQTVQFLDKPFSDPNSPYRNEFLHIRLLRSVLNSPWYDSLSKIVPKHDLNLATQNRPGNPANDFTYITPKGSRKKMYDIKGDYIILFFYNPECPACKDSKKTILQSETITNKISSGRLKLLAMYTDTDTAIWKKHLPEMPAAWIMGRDSEEYLYKKSIYDLRAIPTIYLLDKGKKVLLKDCMSVSRIEQLIR